MCMRKVECAHVLVCVATPGDLWPHYALCTNMLHNGKRARSFLQIESSERDRDRERGGDGGEGEERISQLNFELVKIGQRNE